MIPTFEPTLAQERIFEALDRAGGELSIVCRRALVDSPSDSVGVNGQILALVAAVKETVMRGPPEKKKSSF